MITSVSIRLKEEKEGKVKETLNSAFREVTMPEVATELETKGRDSPSGH